MSNIAEIKRAANIVQAWAALGGPKLRGNHGQAFWRNGDGYNVALDAERGLWYDHVANQGGDVVALVQTVRQCSFRDAIEWLADFTGIDHISGPVHYRRDADTGWLTDLKWATYWKIAVEAMAEDTLAALSCTHPDRRDITSLLRTIRLGDASLVEEYRRWRKRNPQFTAAMAKAGERSDARVQRRLASWVRRYLDGETAA